MWGGYGSDWGGITSWEWDRNDGHGGKPKWPLDADFGLLPILGDGIGEAFQQCTGDMGKPRVFEIFIEVEG